MRNEWKNDGCPFWVEPFKSRTLHLAFPGLSDHQRSRWWCSPQPSLPSGDSMDQRPPANSWWTGTQMRNKPLMCKATEIWGLLVITEKLANSDYGSHGIAVCLRESYWRLQPSVSSSENGNLFILIICNHTFITTYAVPATLFSFSLQSYKVGVIYPCIDDTTSPQRGLPT